MERARRAPGVPDDWGRLLLDESVRTAARVGGNVRSCVRFRAMFLQLSGSEWFGVDEPASFDHRLLALRVGAGVSGLRRRFVPGMADSMAQRGLARSNTRSSSRVRTTTA